ncbi:MAG: hypothetical protein JWO30_2455 [Fibrobacteres bacterium]|nr:hypothetical protein [Fibrobacterota bacterium]
MSSYRLLWSVLCASLAVMDCSLARFPGKPFDGKSFWRNTVKIPAADETPPLVALDVVGRDTVLVLTTGQEPEAVELSPDDSLVLIALAMDRDGGVKDLSLTGNAVVSCKDPITGKITSRSTGFMRRTVSGSPARHRAAIRKSSRFVLKAGDFAALCRGRGITGMVGQATVRTLNFHGGHAVSPRLEFRLTEADAAILAARAPATVTQTIQPPTGSGYGAGSGSMGGSGETVSGPEAPAANCPLSASPSGPSQLCGESPVPFVSPKPPAAAPSGAPAGSAERNGSRGEPQTIPKTQRSLLPG